MSAIGAMLSTAALVVGERIGSLIEYGIGSYIPIPPSICRVVGMCIANYCFQKYMQRSMPPAQDPAKCGNYDPVINQLIQEFSQQILQSQEMVKALTALKGKPASEVEQNKVFRAIMQNIKQQEPSAHQRTDLPRRRVVDEPSAIQEAIRAAAEEINVGLSKMSEQGKRDALPKLLNDYKEEYRDAILQALPQDRS